MLFTRNIRSRLIILLGLFASATQAQQSFLIDKDLSQWDIFMGVPHRSSGIEGYENVEDVRIGTPLGLNNDPKSVFTVIEENGEQILAVSGEIFASLITKSSYANYHFKAQVKWGEKTWPPRLTEKRNSGILYHSIGEYGRFWNAWMDSLEFEVQETDIGDFLPLGAQKGTVKAKSPCQLVTDGKYVYEQGSELLPVSWHDDFLTFRCFKPGDPEREHGQWNQLELITFGNMAIHIINGVVVMTVHDPMYLEDNLWVPMQSGKIQLQSEAAEVFYKDISISPIQGLPAEYEHLRRH